MSLGRPLSRVNEKTWMKLYRADAVKDQKNECAYCYGPLTVKTSTADHIKPRKQGGTTSKANITAACYECNQTKGSTSEGKFLRSIKSPRRGDHIEIWMAWSRRKIFLAAKRSCTRINRLVS